MIKKILLSVAMLAVAVPAYAQVGANVGVRAEGEVKVMPVRPVVAPIRKEIREVKQEINDDRRENRAEIKEIRDEARGEIKDMRDDARAGALEDRKVMMEKQAEMRAEFKKSNEERQVKMLEVRAEMKIKADERKLELKEKLKVVKDEKKKTIVEGLDTKISALNVKLTEKIGEQLTKMSDLVIRLSERADKAKTEGLVVAQFETDIVLAKTAIATAQTAVTAQASKVYAVTVTTEANLKTDLGAVQQQMRADLKVVQDLLGLAKEAVRKAGGSLATILKAQASVKVESDDKSESTETNTQ